MLLRNNYSQRIFLRAVGIHTFLVYEHCREKTCFKYNYFQAYFQILNMDSNIVLVSGNLFVLFIHIDKLRGDGI